ncbi:MAG: hypothetical protein P8Y58_12670, partial [Novosphingobium sp.]
MSFDMAPHDCGLPDAVDPPDSPAAPVSGPAAAFVPHIRTGGYASDPRNKVAAIAMTCALYLAALAGFLLYRPAPTVVPPPARPLVVTLRPLAQPPASKHEDQRRLRPVAAKPHQPRPAPRVPAPSVRPAAIPLALPAAPIAAPATLLPAPP